MEWKHNDSSSLPSLIMLVSFAITALNASFIVICCDMEVANRIVYKSLIPFDDRLKISTPLKRIWFITIVFIVRRWSLWKIGQRNVAPSNTIDGTTNNA